MCKQIPSVLICPLSVSRITDKNLTSYVMVCDLLISLVYQQIMVISSDYTFGTVLVNRVFQFSVAICKQKDTFDSLYF